MDAGGRIIADLNAPPDGHSAVVRIRPEADARRLISDGSNQAQGPLVLIDDLTLETSGQVLILTNPNPAVDSSTAIYRVQAGTGKRILVSDFNDIAQGVVAGNFAGIGLAVGRSGQILVNTVASDVDSPVILRVDPKTGQRTILSNFDDSSQGPLGDGLSGLAVERSNTILVGAFKLPIVTYEHSLFRVNPKTGRRIVLSDTNNVAQGPSIGAIAYITVVPGDRSVDVQETEDADTDDN